MKVPENREADLGRFYLLMFEKEGEGETDLARLLEMERVRERLKPMLFQEPVWETSGEFISDYHEFQCALGGDRAAECGGVYAKDAGGGGVCLSTGL